MALINSAARTLRGELNVGNVCVSVKEFPYNVVEFSILRDDVDTTNVNTLHCTVNVTTYNLENGNITTTAILFGNQLPFEGSFQDVSRNILRWCRQHLNQTDI